MKALPIQAAHLRWPAERFYWAVLDGSVLTSAAHNGRRRLTERLGYLFESVLPGLAIEQVAAVYRRLPGGGKRYVACGLPQSVLEQDVSPGAVSLTPAALPPFVNDGVDLADLNLLTGTFLPKPLRSLERRWFAHVALLLTVCAALLILGLERRIHATHTQMASVAAAKMALYEEVLGPPATRAGGGLQPPALQLTAERRRLERTRSADPVLLDVVDCSRVLAELLLRWPQDVHAQTESMSVAPDSITIRSQVPSMADAQRLADALVSLPGWLLQQPQSEVRRDHIAVTLRFQSLQEENGP